MAKVSANCVSELSRPTDCRFDSTNNYLYPTKHQEIIFVFVMLVM